MDTKSPFSTHIPLSAWMPLKQIDIQAKEHVKQFLYQALITSKYYTADRTAFANSTQFQGTASHLRIHNYKAFPPYFQP